MYYYAILEEMIRVPPSLTKMEVKDAIKEVLREKYEGKINKDIGFILKIVDATPLGNGVVILGDPNIYFKTRFKAITFTVEPNEVYVGYVKDIMEFGAFVVIGPFEALLHISQISKERFSYDRKNKELISPSTGKKIKVGDKLLVKVSSVSMKGDVTDVKISVTMRQDGLGNLAWIEKEKKTSKKTSKKKGKGGK